MIYEVIFYNNTGADLTLPEDVFGLEMLSVEAVPEGIKFSLENNTKNLWCRYKSVTLNPKFELQEIAQADGKILKVNKQNGFTIKLHLRRGYKSPFSPANFVTEFLNTGSPVMKEFWSLGETRGKVMMLRGVSSFVSMDAEEHHAKFSKIEILEPTIKRKTTLTPGVFRLEKKPKVSMVPRTQQELKRLKSARDGIIKRRANIL